MNKNILVGKWKQLRGQIKVAWDKFIHPNRGQAAGKYYRFVGLAQETNGDA